MEFVKVQLHFSKNKTVTSLQLRKKTAFALWLQLIFSYKYTYWEATGLQGATVQLSLTAITLVQIVKV